MICRLNNNQLQNLLFEIEQYGRLDFFMKVYTNITYMDILKIIAYSPLNFYKVYTQLCLNYDPPLSECYFDNIHFLMLVPKYAYLACSYYGEEELSQHLCKKTDDSISLMENFAERIANDYDETNKNIIILRLYQSIKITNILDLSNTIPIRDICYYCVNILNYINNVSVISSSSLIIYPCLSVEKFTNPELINKDIFYNLRKQDALTICQRIKYIKDHTKVYYRMMTSTYEEILRGLVKHHNIPLKNTKNIFMQWLNSGCDNYFFHDNLTKAYYLDYNIWQDDIPEKLVLQKVESKTNLVNSENFSLQAPSDYYVSDILYLTRGEFTYFFTRDEWPILIKKKENPYTRQPISMIIIENIQHRLEMAIKYNLPECSIRE